MMCSLKVLFPTFFFIALLQYFVFAKIILNYSEITEEGKVYKFKVSYLYCHADFMQGAYIELDYKKKMYKNYALVNTEKSLPMLSLIYVILQKNEEGYATIASITKKKPQDDVDYVKARVGYNMDKSGEFSVEYPFNRYYISEERIPYIKKWIRECDNDFDNEANTYAVLRIKEGNAVIQEIHTHGIVIR